MPIESSQAQIEGLATLLVLDSEIKKLKNLREFGFFASNETHRLIPYHTAYLWQSKEFVGPHIIAQSGTAEIDIHAPINQLVLAQINHIKESANAKEIQQINLNEINLNAATAAEWQESLPSYLLWCPLLNKKSEINGGLIFFRDTEFAESEIKMLQWLISSYQFTWQTLIKPTIVPSWKTLKGKPYFIGISLATALILLFPVHISVLGVGTVIPKTPNLINAPMQGVIKNFAVNPGETVKAGQLLLTFDDTDLQSTADVNQKDLMLTEAKLRTAINEGFSGKQNGSRAEIPIIKAQLDIDKAHLDYTNTLLAKTRVLSPSNGIVVFDSKEDWIGQPVQTGERILSIADPRKVALKIIVPVSDMIKLSKGDHGDFYLYGQLSSIPITISILGYNAKLMPNKILAYQLNADFTNNDDIPQLGSQGTARLYGPRVPLIYYLLRRPLQAIRHTFGI